MKKTIIILLAIYSVATTCYSQTRITSQPGWEYHAMYNPTNNDSIWYVYSYDDSRNVFVKDINTGAISSLNIDILGDYHFDLTSDGSKMVFDAYTSGSEPPYSLYLYNFENNSISHLVEYSGYPSFSADGQKIAFNHFNNLCIMGIDGGEIQQLTNDNYDYEMTDWSPDGQYVATTSNRVGNNSEIWIFNVDGSGSQQITDNPSRDFWAKFSPDGSKIAFVSERTGNYDLWIYHLADSSLEQITNHPSQDHQPEWSNDGNKIIFTSTRAGTMDLWELDLQTNSINKINGYSDMKVYPLPASDTIYIEFFLNKESKGTVSIFSLNGEKIIEKTMKYNHGFNKAQLDLGNLGVSGNYILQIETQGHKLSKRFVYLSKL